MQKQILSNQDLSYEEFKVFLNSVKQKVNIKDVVRSYIPSMSDNKALCPFHSETMPSFSINEEEQYFHCFGCGKGGDVINFLMLFNNQTFYQAVNELCNIAQIELPEFNPKTVDDLLEERTKDLILLETSKFYHKNLNTTAKQYLLTERNINEDIIEKFSIGLATGGLKDHLLNTCNFTLDLCLKSGVLKKVENTISDFFYNRIIFPNIFRGGVVSISGRIFNSSGPKYLNLPGKINYLFNEGSLKNEVVFIVEGVLDCITLDGQGFNAVALNSCIFKEDYKSKFLSCLKIYCCLDSDNAGQNGILKIADYLEDRLNIIELPAGLDPNEYFKTYGKEDFEKLINSAKDIIQYKIFQIPADINKIELPEKLDPILKQISKLNPAKVDAYLNYEIKVRFNLKDKDLSGYRKQVKKYIGQDSHEKEGEDSYSDSEHIALFDDLVDLVEYNNQSAFLIKDNNELKIEVEYIINNKKFSPPPLETIPWILPRGEEVLSIYEKSKSMKEKYCRDLYDELIEYHKNISLLPSEEHYDLIVCWDFHTYLLEHFSYSPIICFFAVPERGKSRTGKGMIYIAYRGIRTDCLRDAYIIRMAKRFSGTIFFDVMSVWEKAVKSNCEDILLNRFEKDTKVPRVNPEKKPFHDIDYYEIFGPTIISTNVAENEILGTRAIDINMPQTTKRYEKDLDEKSSLYLKEKLIVFRALYLDEEFPDIDKPAMGRLGDITKPLFQIVKMIYPEKDKVIRWGYHGWHDWSYGGAGTDRTPYGVPKSAAADILTFNYNDLNSLEEVFKQNKGKVACVIMQPFESSKELPKEGFLEGVKKITHENDAVLIFDEIRTGFRVALGGALEYFNVTPDMACFSKAMANGYPISVVVGKKDIMLPSQKTRISGTFFPNTFPMVAALATIKEIQDRNGIEYMWKQGTKLVNGFKSLINDFNIEAEMIGLPVMPMLKFTYNDQELNTKYKNIFFAELVEKGILLHPNHHWFLSLAHTDKDVDDTLNASEAGFKKLRKEIS